MAKPNTKVTVATQAGRNKPVRNVFALEEVLAGLQAPPGKTPKTAKAAKAATAAVPEAASVQQTVGELASQLRALRRKKL